MTSSASYIFVKETKIQNVTDGFIHPDVGVCHVSFLINTTSACSIIALTFYIYSLDNLLERTNIIQMDTTYVLFAAIMMANCFQLSKAIMPVQNLSTDELSLLEFRNQITSDPYRSLANWSSTTHVCNWIGVSCDLHQRIIALNLSDWSLIGTISPHLVNLTSLTSLDISHNNFSGFIPNELSNLHGLKQLNLGNNNLSGEIPSWLGTFTELQLLVLDNNRFTGIIPVPLCNISKLERLDLGYNFLEGRIPQGVANISNLRTLALGYNQLSGSIPSGIFNLTFLQAIDLTKNSLSGTLPMDICNHPSKLQGLYLSYNHLQGEIPSQLDKCRDLEHLSLSYNQFNDKIPKTLGYLTKLIRLYIGGNIFSGIIWTPSISFSSIDQCTLQACFTNWKLFSFYYLYRWDSVGDW